MLCSSSMHLDRRLAAAVAALLGSALLSANAHAEPQAPATSPPETLETPYEDAPLAPPAAPPEAVPPASPAPVAEAPPSDTPPAEGPPSSVPASPHADTRPLGPIRARRRLALTGEIGWNGLAGFGAVLTYYPHPHVGLDLGGGFSLMGWKLGARGRYNFLTSPFTPFVGVGFDATTGLGEVTFDPSNDPNGDPNRDPITLNLKASYLVHGTVGFDFIHKRGFTLIGCLGYSWLLNKDNVEVVAGSLKSDEKRAVNVIFKSGAVISMSAGYAFQ
jgi:hypothetical protein